MGISKPIDVVILILNILYEGVNEMCDIVEEYADAKVAKRDKETAINLFKNGVSIETIIKSVPSLSAEFIEQLKKMPTDQLQNA